MEKIKKIMIVCGLIGFVMLSGIMFFKFAGNEISTDESQIDTSAQGDVFQIQATGYTQSFVLNATLPDLPSRVLVYRIENGVSKDAARSLGASFGFSNLSQESDEGFLFEDGSRNLAISKISGRIWYTDDARFLRERPENLPTTKEAVRISDAYLSAHGLFPEDAYLVSQSTTNGRFVNSDRSVDIPIYQDRQVNYARKPLNRYSIIGDDISVTIGNNGDVIQLTKYWGNYIPDKEYPIISPATAFEKVKRGESYGYDQSMVTGNTTVQVNSIQLVYFTDPGQIARQKYLRPVYYIQGERFGSGTPERYFNVVPAVPELGGLFDE
jgi:hypothetical protein